MRIKIFFVIIQFIIVIHMNSEELINIIEYNWIAGSMPPPHHYEYTITISDDLKGSIVFYPDYRSENTPRWIENFNVSEESFNDLIILLKQKKILKSKFMKIKDPPVGGSLDYLIIVTSNRTIDIPPFTNQKNELEDIYNFIKRLIPENIWNKLHNMHDEYKNYYEE